jgi:hypothetical protein
MIALHNGKRDDPPAVRRLIASGTFDGFVIDGE